MRKAAVLVGTVVAVLALAIFPVAFPMLAVSAASTPASSTVTVELTPSLSLALYAAGDTTSEISNLQFELDPDGVMATKDVVLRVGTNSPRYQLTLQMSGATTDLVQTGATRQIVGTTTNNVTAAAMRQNSWGYSLDATNFSKVPANDGGTTPAATIKNGTRTTTDADTEAYEDTTVTFGVKVDGAIQAGTYANTVVFTAITLDANGDEN